MTRFFALSLLLLLTATGTIRAQEVPGSNMYKTTDYRGFYLGGHASTNGWGFNARYAFTNWFALKTGFESLNLSYNFDFDENGIDYNADMRYKTGGIFLFGEFSYTKNLYISAGFVFTAFEPTLEGFAVEDYQLGDITIPAEDIGTFDMKLEPGLQAAPYIGAGYQAFMGRAKRLTFNFETGFYYMGTPEMKIESDGLLSPTSDPALGQAEYLSDQFSAYKVYPIVKLNLGYRIF